MNETLFKELYQLLFVISTIYFLCVVLIFSIRFVRTVVYDVNTTMKFNLVDKILILLSAALIITYLF
jgi:hypothetical protein